MVKQTYKYTKNYCEENIWHLCQHPDLKPLEKHVLIISNEIGNCSFWNQKSMPETGPVYWDYHVVLMVLEGDAWFIYDFDSSLKFPVSLKNYLNLTFRSDVGNSENKPLFKIYSSDTFTNTFSSDRSHMKDALGNWIFSPPVWSKIERAHYPGLHMGDITDFSGSGLKNAIDLSELTATFGTV